MKIKSGKKKRLGKSKPTGYQLSFKIIGLVLAVTLILYQRIILLCDYLCRKLLNMMYWIE
jgi:hypothetical protein